MAKTDNYLRHTFLKNDALYLIFKYKIEPIKYFTIKKKGYVKHIYDIKGALPKSKDISQYQLKGVRAFRIAQYNKQIVRVVIETNKNIKCSYITKGREFKFSLLSTTTNSFSSKKEDRASFISYQKYRYNPKRRAKLIILDAGHGGRDVGASKGKIREKDLTLSITLKLQKILKKMGYRVLLTRKKDTFMNLKQRTEFANRNRGSLFISIHANAEPRKPNPKVRYEGIEVFYLSIKNSKRTRHKRAVYRGKKLYTKKDYRKMISPKKFARSRRLAKLVKSNLLKTLRRSYKVNDKGVKRKDFWVLLATKMPSILVETGYLTHKKEVKKLANGRYQQLLAEGIAKGINRYYGLY